MLVLHLSMQKINVIELFGFCLDVQLLPLIYTVMLYSKLLSATYHGQGYHLLFPVGTARELASS